MYFLISEINKHICRMLFKPVNKRDEESLQKVQSSIRETRRKLPEFIASEQLRKELKKNHSEIEINDFGAGSRIFSTNMREVSDMVKYSSLPEKYGRLLSRICFNFNIKKVIEFGTSLGLTSLYLAKSKPDIKIETIEACGNISSLAYENFQKYKADNIELHTNRFEDFLKDFKTSSEKTLVYIDGNHSYEACMEYFQFFEKRLPENCIIVLDDIRHNKSMLHAWSEILETFPQYTYVDLFRIGIIILEKSQGKVWSTLMR